MKTKASYDLRLKGTLSLFLFLFGLNFQNVNITYTVTPHPDHMIRTDAWLTRGKLSQQRIIFGHLECLDDCKYGSLHTSPIVWTFYQLPPLWNF